MQRINNAMHTHMQCNGTSGGLRFRSPGAKYTWGPQISTIFIHFFASQPRLRAKEKSPQKHMGPSVLSFRGPGAPGPNFYIIIRDCNAHTHACIWSDNKHHIMHFASITANCKQHVPSQVAWNTLSFTQCWIVLIWCFSNALCISMQMNEWMKLKEWKKVTKVY